MKISKTIKKRALLEKEIGAKAPVKRNKLQKGKPAFANKPSETVAVAVNDEAKTEPEKTGTLDKSLPVIKKKSASQGSLRKVVPKRIVHAVKPPAPPPPKMVARCKSRVNDIEPVPEDIFDFDTIDKIVYINLASRPDRLSEMRAQIEKLRINPDKIERIEAIPDSFGAIGCSKSHIKAIELAKKRGWRNVLVLEDDFNFMVKHLKENLQHLKNANFDWDVIMFSANFNIPAEQRSGPFLRVTQGLTTSGYLVNGHYYDLLLENYRTGLENLIRTQNKKLYAIDVWFRLLQGKNKWYTFTKRGGYQRPSYSNIEHRIVNYCC